MMSTMRALAGLLAMVACAASPAQQETVSSLLQQADEDLRAMRLTTPPGASAYDRYRRVLELDQGNWRALNGLGEIVQRYVTLADEAISGGRFDRASALLDRAERVMPGHELVALSRSDLERARGEAVRGLTLSTAPVRTAPVRTAPVSPPPTRPARPLTLATAPAPAAPPEEPSLHRFAIFPFEFIVPCFVPMGKEERTYLERFTKSRPDTELAWSYYAKGVDESAIPRPRDLWDGNRAQGKPVLSKVVAAGRTLGVQAVMMAWYYCSENPRLSDFTYEVTLFLIDVERERMYTSHQDIVDGIDGVREVFDRFMIGR